LAGWSVEGEAHSDWAREQDIDRAFRRLGLSDLVCFAVGVPVVYCSDSPRDWSGLEPWVDCRQKERDGRDAIVIRVGDGAQVSPGVEIYHNRNPLQTVWAKRVWRE
jgi:hypothetical protein